MKNPAGATPPELAAGLAAAFCLAGAYAAMGGARGAAGALHPLHLVPALALPLALSCLRGRGAVLALAYATAALLAPLLSYWNRLPFLIGVLPAPGQLAPSDLLAGLPCAVFGIALLRSRRDARVPGPGILVDALQGIVAACVLTVLASAAFRGGLFGLPYLLASLALMAGLFKGALLHGAACAAAAAVLSRGWRAAPGSLAAAAFLGIALSAAWSDAGSVPVAWLAGLGLTLLCNASRRLPRRAAAPGGRPVPA